MALEFDDNDVSPLHVAIVVGDRAARDYAAVVRHLCIGMLDEAIQLTVVSTTDQIGSAVVGPVEVLSYRRKWWHIGAGEFDLLLRGFRSPPDVIHAMGGDVAGLAAQLTEHFRCPLLLQVAGLADLRAYHSLRPHVISAFSVFTKSLTEITKREFPGEEFPIETIRPGVHASSSPSCFVGEHYLPTVMAMSPLVGDANLEPLLESVSRLSAAGQELMLFILGSGPKEAFLRRRVDELSLRRSVTFAGNVREWMKVLKGADIFVQTKTAVDLQIPPLEAMAAGMAVIACDDGVEDYFHGDQTVLLVNPTDAGGFQRCLTRLLDDYDFARTLAQQALDHVRQNHAPSAMATKYAQLYRRLNLKERTFRVGAVS